jgi:glycosyltransferase involved in cell wall biosynthesis
MVTTFYPPHSFGGDAVHVHLLATKLAERGHRVRVIHSPAAYSLLNNDSTAALGHRHHPGVEVLAAPGGRAGAVATYLTGAPKGFGGRLAQLLKGFDVVHFHNPSLVGGPGVLELADAVRIYTTHDHWLICPTHVLFRYKREVCTNRTCWRCTVRYGRPPQLWRSTQLMKRAVGKLDALIAPSRFTAELHRAEFPGTRVEVLPIIGPDPGILDSLPELPLPEMPTFVYAGRLEHVKGVGSLIDAFQRVHGAQLLIVGDGALRASLEQDASQLGGVHFLGRRPYPEVLALQRAATAVVVPSAGYETCGAVAAEAMAVGTAVVVRALGPLPELVEDGGGVAVADDEEMAVTLQRLVDEPSWAAELSARAERVYQERWDVDRSVDRYLSLVQELVSGAHPQAAITC